MHCSVWRFTGDPDELERSYVELTERIPAARHVLHAAARTVIISAASAAVSLGVFMVSPRTGRGGWRGVIP